MGLRLLPGILEGTCSGERRHTTSCPNKLGKCWMEVRLLPGILEGTCSGERRHTTGCPNKLGKCWKAELLSLSTIKNNGFLV